MDVDRQVRELVSNLHCLVVEKAQKRLATILKSVIGFWIALIHDPSSKVASQKAQQAFQVLLLLQTINCYFSTE
jgi:hypothetical protein